MGFLTHWRERLTGAIVHHHLEVRVDPLLGKMEQAGAGLWQTTEPVSFTAGRHPISVMVEGEAGPDAISREAFEELGRRYDGLKASIAPMLCQAAPRVRVKSLWDHAALSSVEIWHDPRNPKKPVFALEFELDDAPEFAYIVRLENWRPVDVLVVG